MTRLRVFWQKYRVSRMCGAHSWWWSVKWAWRWSDPREAERFIERLKS
ncbi:MAG: hypothetical protein GVY29_10100 [Spirochaetes bacterium]|jgi:hypothetical protein|nr:hypothetical protein [Spirochaetota bacterium]